MTEPSVLALRSLLFSPGSRPDMMAKAKRSDADALIFDLEDAVAPSARAAARDAVTQALDGRGPPAFVRVSHPSTGEMDADLDAAITAGTFGIVLPKAETASEVAALDEAIGGREQRAGLRPGSIVMLPLVESCRGLHFTYELATGSPRVVGLAFSSGEEGDFMADLEGKWTPAGEAMFYPRSKLVCETRAAGLGWPVDGVCMQLDDEDVLLGECRLARRLGYTAKMAIHPRQLGAIHSVFTPTPDEVADSEGLLAAFHEAQVDGAGAFRYRGLMVDKANMRRAERILARARGGFAHTDLDDAGQGDGDVRKAQGGAGE